MWLAPLFLIALAGLTLPLWLHRFARDTDDRRRYASLMLMEAAEVQKSRKRQLKYWLLLLLRLLLLAALIFAFAGPLLPWKRGGLTGADARLHVIVLDASLSMRAGGAFERAQAEARTALEAVDGNDQAMLIVADHRIRVLADPSFASQRGEWLTQLNAQTAGQSRLDYGLLMTSLPGLIGNTQRRVRVSLITDLRASGTPLRFADLAPPPGVTFDVVDVGTPQVNLAIAGVAFAADDPTAVEVTLRGDVEAANGRELVLSVDGAEKGRRALQLRADAPPIVRLTVGDLGSGEFRTQVRLTGSDALPDDDQTFALLRRVVPKVLLVSNAANADDTAYLSAALGALAVPRLDVSHATAASIATRPLADFAAVLVSDAGLLNEAGVASLQRYVQQGGAAILTLGARSQSLKTVPVGGQTIQGSAVTGKVGEGDRIGELLQSHPVLRDTAGWRDIRFFRQVRVTPVDGDSVLLRLAGGGPLLLERSVGAGRVLVLTSPLDREWNDLALHPLFVRFLGEATTWLAGVRVDAASAAVGGLLTASLGDRRGAQVFDPDGKRALTLDESAGTLRFSPDKAGFYEIRGGGRSDYIAVNVDGRESLLGRLDDDALARWRSLATPTGGPSADSRAATAPIEEPVPLLPVWFWLLLVATLLAFAEPLVANYHLAVQREKRG
ncbi:MAG: BatA and WFA domain-containing protein [Steroidobacteraceae bacterium]